MGRLIVYGEFHRTGDFEAYRWDNSLAQHVLIDGKAVIIRRVAQNVRV